GICQALYYSTEQSNSRSYLTVALVLGQASLTAALAPYSHPGCETQLCSCSQ
ncbi:hypothetical protein LEMLEM_LOCUS14698, partial [Lemmus lemmus]